MSVTYAEGGNYRIELRGKVAFCAVWRRPDVDSATGAQFAREKIAHFEKLARGEAIGMVFDLRDAPPVTGPKTQEAIGQMLLAFEAVGLPMAVVVGDHSVQRLQLTRLVSEIAPARGGVFRTSEEAEAFVRGGGR